MTLEDLGFDSFIEKSRIENGLEAFDLGRVTAEHRERYIVRTESGEYEAELVGNLRFTAESRDDLPAVGDWVAISEYDTNKSLIHAVYPRRSVLERQAVGKSGQSQIIAANINIGIIVIAVNRDFSINRLERYLAICNEADVEPLVLLSKVDLVSDQELTTMLDLIHERLNKTSTLPISVKSDIGIEALAENIQKGKTYCLLGSSGVGKSTLLNKLKGEDLMLTAEISDSIDRGKHVTSHRELFILDNGGIIIDNPGMREVGLTDVGEGIELTFDDINKLAADCKFKDCTHENEDGCAVLEAVDSGEIDRSSYDNWQKMERERAHYESNVEERRRKDKQLGKMIKNVQKIRKKNKF
jgi:ribosome biogenesis GTPase